MSAGCKVRLAKDNNEEERGEKRKVIGSRTDQDKQIRHPSIVICLCFVDDVYCSVGSRIITK